MRLAVLATNSRNAALFSTAVSHVTPEVTALMMPSLLCPALSVLWLVCWVLSGVVECLVCNEGRVLAGPLYLPSSIPQCGGGMDGLVSA
jgi:hypothetical protein